MGGVGDDDVDDVNDDDDESMTIHKLRTARAWLWENLGLHLRVMW
jgi:hypothetical protein